MFVWMSLLWANHPPVTALGAALCVEIPSIRHNQACSDIWSVTQPWGHPGKAVVWQAVLQKDTGGAVLPTWQGDWCCTAFPFPEMLPAVSTFLYPVPDPL